MPLAHVCVWRCACGAGGRRAQRMGADGASGRADHGRSAAARLGAHRRRRRRPRRAARAGSTLSVGCGRVWGSYSCRVRYGPVSSYSTLARGVVLSTLDRGHGRPSHRFVVGALSLHTASTAATAAAMSDLISYGWWENKKISESDRLAAIEAASVEALLRTKKVRRLCCWQSRPSNHARALALLVTP